MSGGKGGWCMERDGFVRKESVRHPFMKSDLHHRNTIELCQYCYEFDVQTVKPQFWVEGILMTERIRADMSRTAY